MVQFVRIDRNSKTPLYLQIKAQLREMIQAGQLTTGMQLPPERALAKTLGVNRGTVANAYRELVAEGWAEAHVGRGTIVRYPENADFAGSPQSMASPIWADLFAPQPQWLYNPLLTDLSDLAAQKDVIFLAAGVPAPDLYPLDAFRRVVELLLAGQDPALLGPCPTQGLEVLREAIATHLMPSDAGVGIENLLIVTGSQQGLDLIARAFLEPGDALVLEAPTYLGALQTFGAAGARLLTVPLDAQGMRLDVLESLLIRYRPKLIYTLPTYQNPSGVTQNLERRQGLLTLASRYGVIIVEDDPYGSLYHATRPPPPLKALDTENRVIYLSTFSKMMFPGLRLGWLAAPRPVIERLSFVKQRMDLYGNSLAQWATAHFIQAGHLENHLQQVRQSYPRRQRTMIRALSRHCPALQFQVPDGGFNLWCRLPAGLKARDLLQEAGQVGVAFAPGEIFYAGNGGQSELRLSYSSQTEAQIRKGVTRLGRALQALQDRRKEAPAADRVIEPLV